MTRPHTGLACDAAAPILILATVAATFMLSGIVWLAACVAGLIGTGTWAPPMFDPSLALRLLVDGPAAVLAPGASFTTFAITAASVTVVMLVGVTAAVVGVVRRWPADPRRRALLRRRQLGDLTGDEAAAKAHRLRPTAPTGAPGLPLLRIDGRDVHLSWEDVALVVMGPRSNKTSAVAVPAVLAAPGLAIATSNKADLWALTARLRAERGPVFTFDPQQIAYADQQWWFDPLRAIRDAPDAARVEAAARLAGHFMGTIGGTRRDPFFHAAGEQVLIGTLLAAALADRGSLRDVVGWLQEGRRDAIAALDHAGATTEAGDLEAALAGADVTTKGIFQTARTATRALTSERILRWVSPSDSWRDPGPELPELEPWQLLHANEPATVYLLSKEGAGTAAPVVAAVVDRLLEVAELDAEARGGRAEPPVVAVLDEAANICPIRTLPQLYSHYGSRGLCVLTMLQSYQQGVGVWGSQGMDALWSAATIKLVGAGIDDHAFLQRLAGLIGDHDVKKLSTSHARGQASSRQYATTRLPILSTADLRALPRTHAVLLSTGRLVGLGELQPWYRGPDASRIDAAAASAFEHLRRAALDAHSRIRSVPRGDPP